MRIRGKALVAVVALAAACAAGRGAAEEARGRWMAGDYHTHTVLSDGASTPEEVARHAFSGGLDWFALSDHGGLSKRDPRGNPLPEPIPQWLALERHGWPAVLRLREAYPDKTILLGLEWNVPGLEHACVAIASDEPGALSSFEYMCDARDPDTGLDLPKWNRTRADAVACALLLQGSHGGASFLLPNHPSRGARWKISDLREMNDAAPDVAFGFEGIPGAQRASARGNYRHDSPSRSDNYRYRTHGGADFMAAEVGGAWDALLGEGRRFFLFANSDFHKAESGFLPGEYARSYTFVRGAGARAVIDGMRSGNSFAVLGGLIDALSFSASAGGESAGMGETLRPARGERVTISVAFRSPGADGGGSAPRVDHVDLISGEVGEKARRGTSAYERDVNPTARVVARIGAGDWTCAEGWCRARIDAGPAVKDAYFRLRGTNLPPATPGETDGKGNPLPDDKACEKGQRPPRCNSEAKARADLWFYSNPIFVATRTL